MHFEGLIAAPYTAMNADGSVNLAMIETQAAWLHRDGVRGAFVCGTTGESLSLTVPEREALAERWVDAAPADLRVVVHVGHNSTEASARLAAHAQKLGAAGVGAMGPCFFRPDRVEGLVAYCEEVAAAAPELPFYYYHIPSLTGVLFPMVDFLKAARDRIPSLAGIKYTWEDLMDFELCRQLDGGRFDMLFGRDEILLCGLVLGARGAVGSTYNYAAPLYLKLIEAFDAGELEAARRLQRISIKSVKLMQALDCSFHAAGKALMKMRGLDCGPVRTPLRNITAAETDRLKRGLEEIGFFENWGR